MISEEDRKAMNLDEAPTPVGWRMLVLPMMVEDKSQGGIILSDDTKNANKHLTCVGEVLSMGELCYKDDRFKLGENHDPRLCKVGDYVVYGAYSGQKVRYLSDAGEGELLILNDDEIKAVTKTPGRIRAYV
jgi:co-chaperonin GroES (HSP10)